MHDRSRFMLVLGADPVKWAKRYDILPFTHPCSRCGAQTTTSIAFASGNCRGLIAPQCECGHPSPPYCIVGDWGQLFPSAKPTHRSAGVARSYAAKPASARGQRMCKYKGCSNRNTHHGLGDGVCLTTGCEWHMAKWAGESKRGAKARPR